MTENAAIVNTHFSIKPAGFKRVHGKFTGDIERAIVAGAAGRPAARTRRSLCNIAGMARSAPIQQSIRPDLEVDPAVDPDCAAGEIAAVAVRIFRRRETADAASGRPGRCRPNDAGRTMPKCRLRRSGYIGKTAEQPAPSANLGAGCSTLSPERRNGSRDLGSPCLRPGVFLGCTPGQHRPIHRRRQ